MIYDNKKFGITPDTPIDKVRTFKYYGGKESLVIPILKRLDELASAYEYMYMEKPILLEAFCGSAKISFNASKRRFSKIIINDKSKGIASYFRSVKYQPAQLIEKIREIAKSYNEDVFKYFKNTIDVDSLDDLTRGAMMYMVVNSTFLGNTDMNSNFMLDTPGKDMEKEIKDIVTLAKKRIEYNHFIMVSKDIIVENMDYMDVFDKYRKSHRIAYLDSPYAPETLQFKSDGKKSGKAKEAPYAHSFSSDDIRNYIKFLKDEKFFCCSFYDIKGLFSPNETEYYMFDELEDRSRGFWKESLGHSEKPYNSTKEMDTNTTRSFAEEVLFNRFDGNYILENNTWTKI